MKKKPLIIVILLTFCTISSFTAIFLINQKKIPMSLNVGYGIYGEGEYAYVSNNEGVQIFHLENPMRPKIVGNIEISYGAFGLVKHEDLLFIAGDSNGLVIANVSNPHQPVTCSETALGGAATNIAVENSIVYVILRGESMEIYNVTDPYFPVNLASYSSLLSKDYRKVVVDGDVAYLADAGRGIEILNISDPSHPFLITNILTPAPIGLYKYEQILYLACHAVGVKKYDVSNVNSPNLLGSYQESGGEAYSVWGNTTHVYVADLQKGVYLLNTETTLFEKTIHFEGPFPHAIRGWDSLICIADQDHRLMVFDPELQQLYAGLMVSYLVPIILGGLSVGSFLVMFLRKKSL
jgi:hypothetical protein